MPSPTRQLGFCLLLLLTALPGARAESFYQQEEMFMFRPDEKKSLTTINRFGPVGLSINLVQPAFTMQIRSVEEGSPAATTGKLMAGQFIRSINGEVLKDIDPRIQLGDLITKAEGSDGLIRLVVQDDADAPEQTVDVKIPVLGTYSPTWPLNCPKSDKIVRNFADYLKKDGSDKGFADMGMLFLLSTGDPGDLDYVRQWAHDWVKKNRVSDYAWHIGHGGLAVCEYYLRTGDNTVMPLIQQMVDFAARDQTFGGWAGRSGMAAVNYGGGGGHLNAGGTLVVPYLMLAKECGANVPDDCLLSALTHYYRWAGRGTVPYGNNLPGRGFAENGKNARLAFAMAAAAALTSDGENSIYAGARDVAAMFSFYSSSYMNHGHTGGGIGEIWRSAAMGLLFEKRPQHYREFMESRRWHYEMSRRFDGSFGILNGEGFYKLNGYDSLEWGAGLPLAYTIPRKHLRLAGAPPTKFSKLHKLPDIPWGTRADADFVTLDSPMLPDGSRIDCSKETHLEDSGMGQNRRFSKALDADTLTRYMHHENIAVRNLAGMQLVHHDPSMTLGFLNSKDARVRRAALDAMREAQTSGKLSTPANMARAFAMLDDPKESWFVKEGALRLIGTFPADAIAPEIDRIIPFLQHQEWWLQHGALVALTPVAGHPDCFASVLPAVGEFLKINKLLNATHPIRKGEFLNNVAKGGPDAIAKAEQSFKDSYVGYLPWQSVQESAEKHLNSTNLEVIVVALADLPGGYETAYDMLTKLYPDQQLPYKNLFLKADPEKLGEPLQKRIASATLQEVIPAYVAKNRTALLREATGVEPERAWRGYGTVHLDKLIEFYQQAFIHDYDWKDFGFPREQMTWHYHSFDPPEVQPWDLKKKPRYRPVTLPAGMEEFHKPGFNPTAKAGWKQGLQPIGASTDGTLREEKDTACYDFCRCHTAMKSLWEKETLLVKGRFKYPAFREGHVYRLLIGGMAHVGAGEGFKIYINGKPLYERKKPTDKRAGAKPIGYMLDKTWWPEFNGDEVDISAIIFKGIKDDAVKANFSLWIQEMKVPPLD